MTDPKLAELRARRAATGQTDTFAEHRATYEDATEEALFSPLRAAVRAALSKPGAPTRAALARAAGIAPENLTHWLAGRRPIPLAAAERLLAALDIEPEARREIGELREQIERAERRAKELLG